MKDTGLKDLKNNIIYEESIIGLRMLNSKEYYEYRIVKICFFDASTEYKYIKNKIYLNENSNISKKETLESDNINEKEYTSKLKKFEKYFEKEKIYN